jgi:HK97 family phage prohead protease
METKHITTSAQLKTAGSEEGALTAVFSTFDQIDRDGDVVLASAIPNGQEVPLVWAHQWDKPIGKGTIHVERGRAIFKGSFWLDTDDGVQAYRKVKNAGSLQEYSWGFQVLDTAPGEVDGQPVRFIKRAEIFEVSPVLVGAGGRGMTGTLAVKRHRPADARALRGAALRAIAKGRIAALALDLGPSPAALRQRAAARIAEARALGVRA